MKTELQGGEGAIYESPNGKRYFMLRHDGTTAHMVPEDYDDYSAPTEVPTAALASWTLKEDAVNPYSIA